MPALAKTSSFALAALDKCALNEIKLMPQPPSAVKAVCEAVAIILGRPTG